MLRAAVVLFVIVGILWLAVFAVGAQERPAIAIRPYPDPYPGPNARPSLMMGWLSIENSETMTGTFPVTIVMRGVRIDAESQVTGNFTYGDGYRVQMYVYPKRPGTR